MSESTKNDAIYLQVCDDEDSDWLGYVTWCQDRIHESDVKYIRADLVESLRQQLADSQKQVVILRDWIRHQGEVTNTCTFNILKEVCHECACHRAKEQRV